MAPKLQVCELFVADPTTIPVWTYRSQGGGDANKAISYIAMAAFTSAMDPQH
jgi:hypothetical protein